MGQESSNSGIVYMTMLSTMIWGILIRVQNSYALFLEAPLSILILEEEEQVDHRQEKVRQEKNTIKIYKKCITLEDRWRELRVQCIIS